MENVSSTSPRKKSVKAKKAMTNRTKSEFTSRYRIGEKTNFPASLAHARYSSRMIDVAIVVPGAWPASHPYLSSDRIYPRSLFQTLWGSCLRCTTGERCGRKQGIIADTIKLVSCCFVQGNWGRGRVIVYKN